MHSNRKRDGEPLKQVFTFEGRQRLRGEHSQSQAPKSQDKTALQADEQILSCTGRLADKCPDDRLSSQVLM